MRRIGLAVVLAVSLTLAPLAAGAQQTEKVRRIAFLSTTSSPDSPTTAAIASIGDPVGSGFVNTLPRPGGDITGLSMQAPDLAAKRLQLLKEAVPHVSRVALLADS